MISATLFMALLFTHWLADFTHFSRPDMLQAKRLGTPLGPIYAHATVHATLMSIILIPVLHPNIARIGLVLSIELISHFCIDVLKGKLNKWFPILQNPAKYWHWYIFGLDQFAHISIIVLICYLCQNK